jgi:hypothetical protein
VALRVLRASTKSLAEGIFPQKHSRGIKEAGYLLSDSFVDHEDHEDHEDRSPSYKILDEDLRLCMRAKIVVFQEG